MKLSHKTIVEAWTRAEGKCECTIESHGHEGRCNKPLTYTYPDSYGNGIWQANRIFSAELDLPNNCEILCTECYSKIQNKIKENLQIIENSKSI